MWSGSMVHRDAISLLHSVGSSMCIVEGKEKVFLKISVYFIFYFNQNFLEH